MYFTDVNAFVSTSYWDNLFVDQHAGTVQSQNIANHTQIHLPLAKVEQKRTEVV